MTAAAAEEILAADLAERVLALNGVYALGDPVTRMLGVARASITGGASRGGIRFVAAPPALAVRVSVVAEYPANVTALADAVRAEIAAAMSPQHTGPLDVEVTVTDVHGPFDIREPESDAEDETEQGDVTV